MVFRFLSRCLFQNEPVKPIFFFKECFLLAGYDSTIGMGKLIGLKSPKDCSVIQMLKAQVKVQKDKSTFIQGAVPFCLTNIPQTMVRKLTTSFHFKLIHFGRSAMDAATRCMGQQRTLTGLTEHQEARREGR